MPSDIRNFCSHSKGNFYPRDTDADVCDVSSANGETTPVNGDLEKPRLRGGNIKPPARILTWDQRAFVRRVQARVAQLNATMDGLSKAAGGSGHELRKAINPNRKLGPTASSLLFVASALHWTVAQVMGTQDPILDLRREREIDPHKMAIAAYLADLATNAAREFGKNYDAYANIVSVAYSIVSEREASRRSISPDDTEFVEDIVSLLRHI